MPNPYAQQSARSAALDEMFSGLPTYDPSKSGASNTDFEILAALKRIEEKLNQPQSLIITGAEVERIIKSLKETT